MRNEGWTSYIPDYRIGSESRRVFFFQKPEYVFFGDPDPYESKMKVIRKNTSLKCGETATNSEFRIPN